jgi:hypothetical protein
MKRRAFITLLGGAAAGRSRRGRSSAIVCRASAFSPALMLRKQMTP